MKPIAAISNFKVALPKYPVPQAECERWLNELRLRTKAMVSGTPQSDEDRRKDLRRFHRFAIQDDKIATRYFECPDVLTDDAQRHHIYNIDRHGPDGAPLSLRSQFFAERAYEIVGEMFETETQPPNHLVHVSCTGYISPSAPQRVVSDKAWDTSVTHAYHMGCYAALPAIRIAQGAVATDRFHNRDTPSRVDVVHTEMCALHVNPSLITPEQIVVQSLFADGHIKYSVSAPDSVESGFQVLNIREKVIAQTDDQMTWIPESWGLRMTLGRAVPAIIQAEVGDFVKALVADSGLKLESVLS
jgi:predicted naringenin-chalcone synthase